MKKSRVIAFSLAIVLLVSCVGGVVFAVQTIQRALYGDSSKPDYSAKTLPRVGSVEKLKLLVDSSQQRRYSYIEENMDGAIMMNDSAAGTRSTATPKAVEGSGEYSTTNVQVAGVDEADLVKTDGEYIYRIANGKIVIARAYPYEELALASAIKVEDPLELYVDGDRLTVISTSYSMKTRDLEDKSFYNTSGVVCTVYDISDRANPVVARTSEIEGNYLSSRKVEDEVYLVTNKYLSFTHIENGDPDLPICRDAGAGDYVQLDIKDVCYFPDINVENYLTITAIDTRDSNASVTRETYLGGGETLYMSKNALYIAQQLYSENRSAIYKFSFDGLDVEYVAKATFPGSLLNQFSMDEEDGNLRVAATEYNYGLIRAFSDSSSTSESTNNIYIFGHDMMPRGSIQGIAPGERIYSARFVGKRGYIVTFKKVDPLFVLDLANPDKPSILGELKIPGYSDYLHPVDENHILGFGKDATDSEYGDWALYQGMKVALFDVSDVANPVQKFEEIIGTRGTESPLLRDHKALLFSPEKRLLAFPVQVAEDKAGSSSSSYGTRVFSGAYVYDFSVESGFQLRAKLEGETGSEIDRLLYIGDVLYTTSTTRLNAWDLNDLNLLKSLNY